MAKKSTLKPYERLWDTNEGMVGFKTYLRLSNSILCRIDLRVGDSETYGVAHVFSGGWVLMAESDGSMLKCHDFKPLSDREKLIRALRQDAKAMAEEVQVVMSFAPQEGTGTGLDEDDGEKET